MALRIAFTGGRNYNDFEAATRVFNALCISPHMHVLVGDASGLDYIIRTLNGPENMTVFRADWKTHGPAAGPIRNRTMLMAPANLLVAFPGGRGTENCIREAKKLGIPVLRVDEGETT